MDPLVTLEQLKMASTGFPDPYAPSPQDDRLTNALNAASTLIRNYTGLRFEKTPLAQIPAARQFEYDGSGFLNIDECQAIISVTTSSGYTGAQVQTITTDEWSAYPLNTPVKMWLRLPAGMGRGISPEMGFTYNLDRIGYTDMGRPSVITVTGVWGWPEIPYDVQQATIWTALSISETPTPYSQESIEGYSRTKGASADSEAIPDRAQIALLPYVVPQV